MININANPLNELQEIANKQGDMKLTREQKVLEYRSFINKNVNNKDYNISLLYATIFIGELYCIPPPDTKTAKLALIEFRKVMESPYCNDKIRERMNFGFETISCGNPFLLNENEIKMVEEMCNKRYNEDMSIDTLLYNINFLQNFYGSIGRVIDMQNVLHQFREIHSGNLEKSDDYLDVMNNYQYNQTLIIGGSVNKLLIYKPELNIEKSRKLLQIAIASKLMPEYTKLDKFRVFPLNMPKSKEKEYLQVTIYNFVQNEVELISKLKKDDSKMFPIRLYKFMEGMDPSDAHINELMKKQTELLEKNKYADAFDINYIATISLWGANRTSDALTMMDRYMKHLDSECSSYNYAKVKKIRNGQSYFLGEAVKKSIQNRLPVSIYFITQYVNAYSEQPDLQPDTLIKTIQEALKTNKIEAEYPLVKLENPDMKSYLTGEGHTDFTTELRRWTELQKMYPKYMPAEMTAVLKAVTDAKIELKLPQEKK